MTTRARTLLAGSLLAIVSAAPAAAQTAAAAPAAAAPPVVQQPAAEQAAPTGRLPMRLALQTEGAIGFYPGDFYNHLIGARVDLVFSPHVSFGGYLGYANLKGKDGRTSNLLAYAQVEYLIGPANHVRIPLRFATGYLPRNGPVMRLSTGFA